jgi:hypothetical protein
MAQIHWTSVIEVRMANQTEFESGQGGSVPSKPVPDSNNPAETGPVRNPGAPDRVKPEEWKTPDESENADEHDSSRSNN